MSTVVERLAESWLDNQTERRYQPAFVQLLVSDGWKVLHNTRHSPLEFGKDVIARSPGGELFAFQLKGNPGSRLTKSQAQEIIPQLTELIDVPVPSQLRQDDEAHVSVLVTNGEVDEEAQLLLTSVGGRAGKPASPSKRFDIWSRGTLLSKLIQHASYIWPSSLEGTRKLLEVYASRGDEIPNAEVLADVLTLSVGRPTAKMSSSERSAKLSSLLLIGEILKDPWYRKDNHYALFRISILVIVFGMRFADQRHRLNMLTEYSKVALGHAADLLSEAADENFNPREVWADSDLFGEFDIMAERVRLVADCAAALVISGSTDIAFPREQAANLLSSSFNAGLMWGQASVPSAIVRYWALRLVDATQFPDRMLGVLLSALVAAARGRLEGVRGLPDPYFDFEECWRRQVGDFNSLESSLITDDFRGHTWFATPLLFMLAKRNWKQSCKALWPSYSKIIHDGVELNSSDFFDAILSKRGKSVSEMFYGESWTTLVRRAVDAGECAYLEPFKGLTWVLACYIGVVPYRAWTNVIMWLDTQVCSTWYSREHLAS